MSTATKIMQYASPGPCFSPVDIDILNSEDRTKPHGASEEPAMFIEEGLAKNMSNTLEEILVVLRGSTIAEECGKDVKSRFWAMYKKISNEYDNDFLERANDDMSIILTFAGLFSAVNSTFIVGMQPNPGDTTNALLLKLIQISVNGPNSVQDISNLSSSTEYTSSNVWMQTLAYASLAFSVMAAFGAVLGKQWLNSYKAARGRGSLSERGIQRQMKLDGIESFCLQTVLQAFLVLLQISLLLFGMSLSANMWTHQTTISSVIMSTTAFGMLFYVATIVVSVWRPGSPFQTPGSYLARGICKIFLQVKPTLTPNIFSPSSAIRWTLETSTNPDVVEAAAAMVPLVQWPPGLNASAIYTRLLDTFLACRSRPELSVTCGKAMAHLCVQSVKINPDLLQKEWITRTYWGSNRRFICDAFIAGRDAFYQFKNTKDEDARPKHKANARTALRTMLVHGLHSRLSLPDDEELIWNGDLRWHHCDGLMPSCEKFDWLIDMADVGNEGYEPDEKACKSGDVLPVAQGDYEMIGDALLALSAMQGLGSPAKQSSYIRVLIRCMSPPSPLRVRHAALRIISDAREELASYTSDSMPQGVDAQLLDQLSCALVTAAHPSYNQTVHDSGPNTYFHNNRDERYVSLVFALTTNEEWCQRLARDGHLKRCISLVDEVCKRESWFLGSYLPVIFGRIDPSGKDLPFSPAQDMWRLLIGNTWNHYSHRVMEHDYINAMPALVAATRLNFPDSGNGVPREWLTDLIEKVHQVLVGLLVKDSNATPVRNGKPDSLADAALSSVQGLYVDLSRIIELMNTL